MSTFTVHVPPGIGEDAARADRTVFVREGFDWAAFWLGPLFLLYRGLWRYASLPDLRRIVMAAGLAGLCRSWLQESSFMQLARVRVHGEPCRLLDVWSAPGLAKTARLTQDSNGMTAHQL